MKTTMMATSVSLVAMAIMTSFPAAQGNRPASPAGASATQIGGKYVNTADGSVYQGGKWIEITYGRPIKRGRDLWGSCGTSRWRRFRSRWDNPECECSTQSGRGPRGGGAS